MAAPAGISRRISPARRAPDGRQMEGSAGVGKLLRGAASSLSLPAFPIVGEHCRACTNSKLHHRHGGHSPSGACRSRGASDSAAPHRAWHCTLSLMGACSCIMGKVTTIIDSGRKRGSDSAAARQLFWTLPMVPVAALVYVAAPWDAS